MLLSQTFKKQELIYAISKLKMSINSSIQYKFVWKFGLLKKLYKNQTLKKKRKL